MKPKKRSFSISGHKTSISIEEPFWLALRDIAREENLSLAALVGRIDKQRQATNLSSAIRVHILMHYRTLADGAGRAGQVRPDADIPSSGSNVP
ncbi:MAG TPA: ribbon-helix-helix domain-containing protein [Hyphomicrobiaceae bacterium]|nr:ribbon-helix-helix domain-containing protein [Hyphomicrobiaceae bacterium]